MNKLRILLIATLFTFSSCDDETFSPLGESGAFLTNYANMAYANYNDALEDVKALKTTIDDFVADPTSSTHQAAKEAWLTARESYGTTEAFRFAGGPIDEYGEAPEGALNAWPLDEAYVDYIYNNGNIDNTGIINDGVTTIDAATLESLNEQGGEANISIGYHAIEFLLWGQDNTDPSAEMAGQRSYTDFIDGQGSGDISNEIERGNYLKAVTGLLVDHLQYVVDEWDAANSNNYRAAFLAGDADDHVQAIIQSIAIFSKGELAGERMIVAYTNKDQEDEHSCFSDNTHRDIILNAQGVNNIYNGRYGSVAGTGLADLVTLADASINTEILNLLDQIKTDNALIHVPFDHAISNDSYRPQVLTAANNLKDLGDKLVEAANALGFTVSAELPE